ncbi:Ccc1 family, partial [Lipomyces starkeyi]
TKVVVFGGLAELIAGAISMGLGGYLGERLTWSYIDGLGGIPGRKSKPFAQVCNIFAPYDIPSTIVADLIARLSESPNLTSFLMNFHYTLPEPSGSRALNGALTIALGYFVPLLPYFFVGPHEAFCALRWSVSIMVVSLFLFGYGKTCLVAGWRDPQNIRLSLVGGLQMVLVGGIAAGSEPWRWSGFSKCLDLQVPLMRSTIEKIFILPVGKICMSSLILPI